MAWKDHSLDRRVAAIVRLLERQRQRRHNATMRLPRTQSALAPPQPALAPPQPALAPPQSGLAPTAARATRSSTTQR
jgi:hypothetical protein